MNEKDYEIIVAGKKVNPASLKVENIDMKDYPDFSDAQFSEASFEDGTELTDAEVEELNDKYYELTNEIIMDRQLYQRESPYRESLIQRFDSFLNEEGATMEKTLQEKAEEYAAHKLKMSQNIGESAYDNSVDGVIYGYNLHAKELGKNLPEDAVKLFEKLFALIGESLVDDNIEPRQPFNTIQGDIARILKKYNVKGR